MKPVVLNFRGTYGAGKTHLARRIMDLYHNQTPHFIEGRKKPLFYTFDHPMGGNQLAVVGSYETVCGGCDTIPNADQIFNTIGSLQLNGYDVMYESLMLTADVGRTSGAFLVDGWNLHVIHLQTTTEECIAGVMSRRADRGDVRPLDPKNLLIKVSSAASSVKTLESYGVPVYRLTREQAFYQATKLLNIHP